MIIMKSIEFLNKGRVGTTPSDDGLMPAAARISGAGYPSVGSGAAGKGRIRM